MHYPVVLLQGDLVEARETARSISVRRVDHIQFRRSVTRPGVSTRDYQIDVVCEKFLPNYLDIVEAELAETAKRLRQSKDVVRNAIDAIVTEATAVPPHQIGAVLARSR